MKILSIIYNQYSKIDFALYLKDNYEGDKAPTLPVNSDQVNKVKSGMPILLIEFWSNDLLRPYKWLREQISYVLDEDSEFTKRGSPWSEFIEVYNSF